MFWKGKTAYDKDSQNENKKCRHEVSYIALCNSRSRLQRERKRKEIKRIRSGREERCNLETLKGLHSTVSSWRKNINVITEVFRVDECY
jgi:hypothetical protein